MSRWRIAALAGAAASLALLWAGGAGALVVILPAWLIGLALRHDNHTGSLLFAALLVTLVVLVMLGLIAGLAIVR